MDHGEVRTDKHNAPICELELKAGEPRQLYGLALALLDVVPFELEYVSKAELGYRLLSGFIEIPTRGDAPVIHKTDTLGAALQALV